MQGYQSIPVGHKTKCGSSSVAFIFSLFVFSLRVSTGFVFFLSRMVWFVCLSRVKSVVEVVKTL